MIYKQFDVVVVPFPFTDQQATKRRPALVLSDDQTFNSILGRSVLSMITSGQHPSWPLDVPISNLQICGLTAPSMVRMKLFTLDDAFVLRKIGQLDPTDQMSVQSALQQLFRLSS